MGKTASVTQSSDRSDLSQLKTPSAWKIMWDECRKDKLAIISVAVLFILLAIVYLVPLFLSTAQITNVDILSIKQPPSPDHWLGTDPTGRDVFGELIIGTRNSFTIGLGVTVFSSLIGVFMGIVGGYFGGLIDNICMRILDFVIVLPFLMIVIALMAIQPRFNLTLFICVFTAFLWPTMARLVRAKTLAERQKDYVSASKTLGTPDWKIILIQVLPNVASIIIINFTLELAGNIGIESGLSYLGFGLPPSMPSLGTLISYATDPDTIQYKWWIWLPAAALILVLMLSINFVGQALKRSADARQRS
ncbi:MAG: ABC transporter permease [Sporolactobacillus sp.]